MILEGLQTARLKFRSLSMEDKKALMEFFNSPEALKYFTTIPPGEQSCIMWIQRQLDRYSNDGYGLCAIEDKVSGKLLGMCGLLKQEVDGETELEVGYSFLPTSWGKGYASEAAIACKEFAFENNMSDSIISIIHIDNIPSQKVAIRNGMKKEKETIWRELPVFIFRVGRR